MLPRFVLRVRKAVNRRVHVRSAELALDGPEIEARWNEMLRVTAQDARDAERRLERAEKALNSLNWS